MVRFQYGIHQGGPRVKTGRRTFLKTVAAGGAAVGQSGARGGGGQSASPRAEDAYPRTYTGEGLRMIAFPLGGIGAGTVCLNGRGSLQDWEIFNRPDRGARPDYAFVSIWAQPAGEKPVSFVLESQLLPPYEGSSGLGSHNAPGLPRLQKARFTGEYPMARIDFEDANLPVEASLEAFTPIVPLDVESSSLPAAVLRYRVRNPRSTPTTVSLAFSLDNPLGRAGRSCAYRNSPGIAGLEFTNPFLPGADPLSGSIAVAVLDPESAQDVSYVRGWVGGKPWLVGPLLFWDAFSVTGTPGRETTERGTVGSLAVKREIPAGESAAFTFLLTWRFPNRTPKRCGFSAADGDENLLVGNHYCTRFASAWAVAEHAARRLGEDEPRTRKFVEALRRTTMPAAVREGATSNLATLASQTSFMTADGRFHAFEGCNNTDGCCSGSCTHVWNYEAATAHLFPSLSRSLRETSFMFNTAPNGRMAFRELLPTGKQLTPSAAADGQMGQIMHLYLDWRLSGDTEWLRTLWPSAQRALEFAWGPGGWDSNRDGVMEGVQHNTYDVEFFGPNPLCGVWYLGALRAAEEMARAVGDAGAAAEYRQLFEKGSRWIDANLFNGEYYIQKIQGSASANIAAGLRVGMGASDTEHPDFQMGEGCLVDQLVGQYFAHLCGLGLLLDENNIRKTLESIYRYNYKRRLDQHPSVQRTYALNDEAGLIICDYGRVARPEIPFPYFAEVMTGFEYSAAALMMHHGMVDQGVECIANIRRRFDGARRNPWNEAECGYHYARAMASWSAIPALCGWSYHAGDQALVVKPRVNETNFESFWSCAKGWGSVKQTLAERKRFTLSVEEGALACRALELTWSGEVKSVALGDQPAAFQVSGDQILLSPGVLVNPGRVLAISS